MHVQMQGNPQYTIISPSFFQWEDSVPRKALLESTIM